MTGGLVFYWTGVAIASHVSHSLVASATSSTGMVSFRSICFKSRKYFPVTRYSGLVEVATASGVCAPSYGLFSTKLSKRRVSAGNAHQGNTCLFNSVFTIPGETTLIHTPGWVASSALARRASSTWRSVAASLEVPYVPNEENFSSFDASNRFLGSNTVSRSERSPFLSNIEPTYTNRAEPLAADAFERLGRRSLASRNGASVLTCQVASKPSSVNSRFPCITPALLTNTSTGISPTNLAKFRIDPREAKSKGQNSTFWFPVNSLIS
mmetsp:Transcript_7959/g.13794  ORF Transcript_7959/g.13794 Transcript_7959/m.13794 type:complete len:267 (-) Transcript_7959:455-1255(-)